MMGDVVPKGDLAPPPPHHRRRSYGGCEERRGDSLKLSWGCGESRVGGAEAPVWSPHAPLHKQMGLEYKPLIRALSSRCTGITDCEGGTKCRPLATG